MCEKINKIIQKPSYILVHILSSVSSHSCTSSHRWYMLGVGDNRGGISKWFVLAVVKLNVSHFSGNHLETPPGSSSLLEIWKPQVWTCCLCVWLVNCCVTLLLFTNTPAFTGKMPLQRFSTNLMNHRCMHICPGSYSKQFIHGSK